MWLLLVAGCATQSWFELGVEPGPTAVGAHLYMGAQSGNCHEGERAAHCTFDTVVTKSVTLDPSGIFERDLDSNVAVDLIAVGEGTTLLTVVANNGDETKTFTRAITATAADHVAIEPMLRDGPCSSPARFATGTRVSLPTALYRGATQLHGHQYVPFALTGGTLDTERSTDVLLEAQLTDPMVEITSPIDPNFAFTAETFAPAAVEAIAIGDVRSWFPLSVTQVPVDLLVGGQATCADSLSRTVTVSTPQICQIYEDSGTSTTYTEAGMTAVPLRAYNPGACTITVTLDGTALTATQTFIITM